MPDQKNNENRNSWWQYIAAANATHGGSVIMLLIGLAVGFSWGYYTKYKSYKSDGAQIVNQAINNQRLDSTSTIQMVRRSDELGDALRSLGYSDSEIRFLIKGDVNALDKIKNKFNRYMSTGEAYTPRDDCSDDYLGREASEEVNELIISRFNKKADGSNEE